MAERPNLLAYFMRIADIVSSRATCDRAHVGCVLVRDRAILSTGYNGSPPGMEHCDEVGHDIVDGHCIRTVHAEENAIIHCAKHGVSTQDSLCFCTMLPCVKCVQKLLTAGIREIYFRDKYASMSEDDKVRLEAMTRQGLIIWQINMSGIVLDCSPNAPYDKNPNRSSPKVTNLW